MLLAVRLVKVDWCVSGGGGGGKQQGLGPRNDVLTACKAICEVAVLRKGGKIFRSN